MPDSLAHPALRRLLPRALAAALLTGAAAAPAPAVASGSARVDGKERNVIRRINAIRAQHGLGRLHLHSSLSAAADRHSLRQRRAGTLTHQVAGESAVASRLSAAVAGKDTVGEVVLFARGRTSSRTLVRAWMDSPGHRAILLSRGFHAAGIGIRSRGGALYATIDVAGN